MIIEIQPLELPVRFRHLVMGERSSESGIIK